LTRIDPTAAAGFASAAEVYERARPSYPAEAIEWLIERTRLGPGRTVIDVGAGTGKLTRLLVPSGARVVAVEPVAEMRALIGGAEAVDATAEDLPFEDGEAHAITVAQAFHWFDHDRALPELWRVLRSGGALVLVWNMRDLDHPVQRGVEELLAPIRGDTPLQRAGHWREPLERSSLFGAGEIREFRYEQRFTSRDLCDRVASTSFVAAMSAPARDALLAQVRELVRGLDEPFPFPYVTEVHVYPRVG
jgi:ubiquinone/menaquinone biosynthesis C-methylase UbiE